MYCSTCGTPVASGLSFCNRCGTGLTVDRESTKASGPASSLITAIVLVAIFGLGIMFGGSIALKKGGDLETDVVFMFMTFSFAIVGLVELFLLRQLSRVLGAGTKQQRLEPQQQPLFQPAQVLANGVRPAQTHGLVESIPSVTEHTTRTLAQSRQFVK